MFRLCMFCGALIYLCVSCQGADPAAAPAGLGCVTDLTVPEYRGLPWLARLSGEANVSVVVGPGGTIATIDVESQMTGLNLWLKSAMSSTRFLDSCAGQTVRFRFVYRLMGAPEDAPRAWPRNDVRLLAGNTFEITAAPPVPRIQP